MKSRRARTSRARRWAEVCLLLAGAAGVGIWGWSHVRMAVSQMWANHELDHRIARQQPSTAPAPGVRPAPLANGALIGRLEIPRLKLRAVVREGAGRATLDVALGHIPGTALPGQPGNVAVAGHRDTLFRGLRHIEKDDVIQFQTPGGNYDYKVESTSIVKPSDVGVLRASAQPEMTLVTCYPFYYVGFRARSFHCESAPGRCAVRTSARAAKTGDCRCPATRGGETCQAGDGRCNGQAGTPWNICSIGGACITVPSRPHPPSGKWRSGYAKETAAKWFRESAWAFRE